jgi:hypothetical protein
MCKQGERHTPKRSLAKYPSHFTLCALPDPPTPHATAPTFQERGTRVLEGDCRRCAADFRARRKGNGSRRAFSRPRVCALFLAVQFTPRKERRGDPEEKQDGPSLAGCVLSSLASVQARRVVARHVTEGRTNERCEPGRGTRPGRALMEPAARALYKDVGSGADVPSKPPLARAGRAQLLDVAVASL